MTAPTGRRTKGPPLAQELAPRVAELAADGLGRNAIARELDVSPSTVTTAARHAGVTFGTAATEAATVARVAQAADARAELAERAATVASKAARRLEVELDASVLDPPTVRALATVFGIGVDKLATLLATVPDADEHRAREALDELMAGIFATAEADPTDTPTPT